MTVTNDFLTDFLEEFMRDCYQIQLDNVDTLRFPTSKLGTYSDLKSKLKGAAIRWMSLCRFMYIDGGMPKSSIEGLKFILSHREEFEYFYSLLDNETSRNLMKLLLAYKVLGNRHVRLPLSNSSYWQKIDYVKNNLIKQNYTFTDPILGHLDYFELNQLGFPISLHAHILNVLCTFVLQQYRYVGNNVIIQVEPGETVIDAGGCWGDTALYFASRVNKTGRVYCFEFVQSNLSTLHQNLALNEDIAERITVVPYAVWSESNQSIQYDERGPGSTLITKNKGSNIVKTKSIDDFVEETVLDRVDFIKMDIEGSELLALQGAERTLRHYKPKLAIALYHRADDFIVIPKYLSELNLGYKFFLDHFTIHREETVLFAC